MDGQVRQASGPAAAAVVSPRAFAEAMRAQTDQMLEAVMGAVNAAADGAWINGSEMRVRDLMEAYRRGVYQAALQHRAEAAEAAEGAFPPGGPVERPTPQEQGH